MAWTAGEGRGPADGVALRLALAACGAEADEQARIECYTLELAVAHALPFQWINPFRLASPEPNLRTSDLRSSADGGLRALPPL